MTITVHRRTAGSWKSFGWFARWRVDSLMSKGWIVLCGPVKLFIGR